MKSIYAIICWRLFFYLNVVPILFINLNLIINLKREIIFSNNKLYYVHQCTIKIILEND